MEFRLAGGAVVYSAAEAWNAFLRPKFADLEYKESLRACPERWARYRAVLDAISIPVKRKAIRVFLEGEKGAER